VGGVHSGADDEVDRSGAAEMLGADEFAAQARVQGAVRDRHRRAASAARALEDATVVTALLGALDRSVTLHLTGHDPVAGTVYAVGADVVEVHGPAATWWIALDAIAAVETTHPPLGDPADRADTTLIDLATDLVDTTEPVTAMLADGISLHGDVLSAGSSLLLRQQHPDRTVVISLDHLVGIGRRTGRVRR
jgi:hypothetical protein